MLLSSLDSLELKPQQKTAVEGIEADLHKLHEQHEAQSKKLASDVADGVAAGKIDHKKTDADVRELTKAVQATVPGIQDAVNRLHKTLEPAQRKALVESMHAKAEKMREHGPGMHGMGMHDHERGEAAAEHGKAEHGKAEHGKAEHERGEAGGWGHHEGDGGERGPMHALTNDLALTPEQTQKIHAKLEAEMKAQKPAMQTQMVAMGKQMDAIGKAFETDAFDAKKAGVGQQAPEMAKRMATTGVKFAEIVLAVLTPEQREKFAAHVREHASEPE
jgi:Spy/CpxP family protein refolding chaperone